MATIAAAAAGKQQRETARGASENDGDPSSSPSSSSIGVDRPHRPRKPDAFDDERFDAVAFVNEMFPTGALNWSRLSVAASLSRNEKEIERDRRKEESSEKEKRRFGFSP